MAVQVVCEIKVVSLEHISGGFLSTWSLSFSHFLLWQTCFKIRHTNQQCLCTAHQSARRLRGRNCCLMFTQRIKQKMYLLH